MTTLTWSQKGFKYFGLERTGSSLFETILDNRLQEIRPSTDTFLETVTSALNTIYSSESDHIKPKPLAFYFAKSFLDAIRDEPKVSRVSMDSDGEPILEWKSSASRKLTLSFGEDGDISFAGRFAENYIFGNEKFDGSPSEAIMSLIEQASRSAETY